MPSGKRASGATQAFIVTRMREEMAAAGGMTQAELARRAKVPETTLSKIFHGDSALDVEQAAAIAAVFGLAVTVSPVSAVVSQRRRKRAS